MAWSLFKSPEERAREERDFNEFREWVELSAKLFSRNCSQSAFKWMIPFREFCQIMYEALVIQPLSDESRLYPYAVCRAPDLLHEDLTGINVSIILQLVTIYVDSKKYIKGVDRENKYLTGEFPYFLIDPPVSGNEDMQLIILSSMYMCFNLRKAQQNGTFEKRKEQIISHQLGMACRIGME